MVILQDHCSVNFFIFFSDEWKKRMKRYDEQIEKHVMDVKDTDIDLKDIPRWNHLSIDDEDEAFRDEFQRVISDDSIKDADEILENNEGQYINMEVGLPRGEDGEIERATVKKRVVDVEGKPVGKPHSNPLLDSSLYEIEYLDGTVEVMSANLIAENILSQVDEEGHRQMMLDEIIDHRSNKHAVKKENGFVINVERNTKRRVMTTKGWELCIQWKDGSTNWVALKDMKNSYPVEVA